MEERIQKIIANYGNYSRREVERLIIDGRVKVNNLKAELGQKISLSDIVEIDGKRINFKTKHHYYLVYKPKGYISSREDELNRRVIDLVPNSKERNLFTIGRLDVNTTGIIIVTTDGELSQLVNSPKSNIPKTYLVWLKNSIRKNDILALKSGIQIDENTITKPIKKIKIIHNENNNFLVKITIYEGKKNQIRRMFEELDNEVINLKRIQIGGLLLDNNLLLGDYKRLQQKEIYEALGIKKG